MHACRSTLEDPTGQLAFLEGDLTRARELFQSLLRAAPNHVAVLQSAGLVELRLNAPSQAEVLLAKALQLAPDSASTRQLLARAQLALGQPDRALATLEPLTSARPPVADALTLAARAHLLAGRSDQATALFERAAKIKPDDPGVRTAMAVSNLARGRTEPALAELQSVAASDTGTTADLALIAAQMRRGAWNEALHAIDGLERKQPNEPQSAHLRGQVLMARQDAAGARQAFEQAVQREPRYFPSVAALAALDFRDGKADAAKARFEALLKLDPRNGAAHQALAELAARSGAGREAVAHLLEQAVKASPGDVTRRLALIDHHLATSDVKSALTAAQAGLAQLPDNYELLGRLGRAQLASGETQQALGTFNRMVSQQGRLPAGYLGLMDAQMASGDLPGAARTGRKLLEIQPDQLAAQRGLIAVALRQKQPAQAVAVARDVQRQRPDQAVGWTLEGEIELVQQHWDAAAAVLRKAVAKAEPGVAPERLHQALRRGGKAAEADAFERGWLRDHPRDLSFLFYLGDVALLQKDYPAAEQRYRAVLALAPEHAPSLNNVAWLMLEQKKPGALAVAEQAVRAAPDRPALLDTLALAYAAEQQWPKAIEAEKRALAMTPDDAGLRLNLARFYVRAGEKKLARAELDRLAALGDRFPRQDDVAALGRELGGRQP